MSRDNKITKVLAMPAFRQLVASRNKFRFVLSIIALLSHFFFVGGIAFYRDLFAQPISSTSTVTWGIIFAALVITLFVALQAVYIFISDRNLDPQQDKVKAEVESNA